MGGNAATKFPAFVSDSAAFGEQLDTYLETTISVKSFRSPAIQTGYFSYADDWDYGNNTIRDDGFGPHPVGYVDTLNDLLASVNLGGLKFLTFQPEFYFKAVRNIFVGDGVRIAAWDERTINKDVVYLAQVAFRKNATIWTDTYLPSQGTDTDFFKISSNDFDDIVEEFNRMPLDRDGTDLFADFDQEMADNFGGFGPIVTG